MHQICGKITFTSPKLTPIKQPNITKKLQQTNRFQRVLAASRAVVGRKVFGSNDPVMPSHLPEVDSEHMLAAGTVAPNHCGGGIGGCS